MNSTVLRPLDYDEAVEQIEARAKSFPGGRASFTSIIRQTPENYAKVSQMLNDADFAAQQAGCVVSRLLDPESTDTHSLYVLTVTGTMAQMTEYLKLVASLYHDGR